MKFGFVVPWGDADDIGDLAAAAEHAGWDGLFVWEPVWGVDAWISLGLAAVRTSKIRLGTLLTPPSRRRPWELASQVATVDRMSAGRVTLSVGLGALDSGFEAFGEECDRRIRAELMDECLDIVCGLWDGQPFEYAGSPLHGHADRVPDDRSHGATPAGPDLVRRCARSAEVDGAGDAVGRRDPAGPRRQRRHAPAAPRRDGRSPDETRRRTSATSVDIIIEGAMAEHSPAAFADAGATWWIESMWDAMNEHSPVTAAHDRLRLGPPT